MVVTIRNRYMPVYRLPAALALAGPAFLVVVTHGSFVPLAVGWWILLFVVASIKNRRARIGVTVALIPICVLTTFEGGLFMLPAVVALLVIDTTKATPNPTHTAPRGSSH